MVLTLIELVDVDVNVSFPGLFESGNVFPPGESTVMLYGSSSQLPARP